MNADDLVDVSRHEAQRSEEVVLTVKEFARLKRVSRRTVERWIRRGLVKAERIGRNGHWRINAA